ncbi:His Kinase A (phospho-acceptor) domain-containing protein [Halopseudomonas xinjiangensis]|uniref:histidine kinase n=1 Tax=Halopseudomonas xinjiangensis TaxID=487184 RepID=A0A1H1R556_9GAMM|nr:response regulator [Halopseudomonas xinjiangensis]SDS30745.1 His Kinase A (phospho-acceptor) domain-containing protein [Halopseudomonas xinjiangensis]
MTVEQQAQARTLSIVAPFKGDALSMERLFGERYSLQIHQDLSSLSAALGSGTGLILLTEESLLGDASALDEALGRQPSWSDIPIILLASNNGRSGRDTEIARRRLPRSAGYVVVLERPLSSASLLSAVAAAWGSRERQFEMRDRLAELAEERGRMRILLENVPVGICFMDGEGRSVISNPLYRHYVPGGIIPSMQSETDSSWVGLDADGRKLEPHMFPGAKALRGESGARVDFCHSLEDGDESWMRVSAVPLYGNDRKIIGAAAVIVDINEEKQAELSLRRFNEELETQVQARTQALNAAIEQLKTESDERARAEEQLRQSLKMEAVGQLTGGIAHDFNNMLTGVISALELIKMRMAKGNTDDVLRFMDAANSSAQRAASLTQRLLAFSRRQPLDAKPLSINHLAVALKDLLQRTVSEQIALKLDLCEDDPWVNADANQLENAILNLAINARDAMPDGGELSIRTRIVNTQVTPALVCVEVIDTGCGIPEAVLTKVTEPFFTTKPIGQGTGLGLSMVFGFAQQSNGRLSIDSVPGVGTTVSICLPEHPKVETDSLSPQQRAASGRGQAVLLVEDDESVRLINQEVLEELGYQVCVARDGEEALECFHKLEHVDLLITDVGLPGMNGRQLAEVIQQLQPRLPVLFLTGYAESAMDQTDFLGPYMQLLTKPFTLDALASRVATMLAYPALHSGYDADTRMG